jgi:hypothetical protein
VDLLYKSYGAIAGKIPCKFIPTDHHTVESQKILYAIADKYQGKHYKIPGGVSLLYKSYGAIAGKFPSKRVMIALSASCTNAGA